MKTITFSNFHKVHFGGIPNVLVSYITERLKLYFTVYAFCFITERNGTSNNTKNLSP